ncbi:hypothetical protein KUCAC02_018160 [Chaenocephalus aceratus]|uniref:Uncharacterized protein n=1 Tax=Chaenocephalus aceratus TaxID=36190 RepID=A0ACB9W905_CHAAC|nr:hypothetical protein KUCAC02_018160 [Chaenocephalus aceratus]
MRTKEWDCLSSELTMFDRQQRQGGCYRNDDPMQPVTSDETVSVGGTVTLTCRVAESDNSSLQWSNTAQQTLYFGEKRGKRQRTNKYSALLLCRFYP